MEGLCKTRRYNVYRGVLKEEEEEEEEEKEKEEEGVTLLVIPTKQTRTDRGCRLAGNNGQPFKAREFSSCTCIDVSVPRFFREAV